VAIDILIIFQLTGHYCRSVFPWQNEEKEKKYLVHQWWHNGIWGYRTKWWIKDTQRYSTYPDVISEVIFATVIRNFSVMTSDMQLIIRLSSRHGFLPLSFAAATAAVFLFHTAYSRDDSLWQWKKESVERMVLQWEMPVYNPMVLGCLFVLEILRMFSMLTLNV